MRSPCRNADGTPKTRFASSEEASRYIAERGKSQGSHTSTGAVMLTSYECEECGWFHMSSKASTRALGNRDGSRGGRRSGRKRSKFGKKSR